MATITIGSKEFSIEPLPLGTLRTLIPTLNRVSVALLNDDMGETVIDEMIAVIAIGARSTVEEIQACPGTFAEVAKAIETIARVSGLVELPVGERGAVETAGTISTAG